jgi:peptide/nickel transport system substrate-binding protein
MNGSYWSKLSMERLGRRRFLIASGVAATGAGLLVACGSSNSKSGSSSGSSTNIITQPVDTTKQAKRGGIIKDRTFADPPTLDILTQNNPLGVLNMHAYNLLTQFKPGYMKPSQNEVVGDLAESWEMSPDGLQITMKLRQDVKFHNKPPVNGRPMDIDDVLFSWNRFSSKYSTSASFTLEPGFASTRVQIQ